MTKLSKPSSLSSDVFWHLMDLPRQHDDGLIQVTGKTLVTVICLIASYYAISTIHNLFFSPLKDVPGPFLARVTRWWEYLLVQGGVSNLEYVRLHKKYGRYPALYPSSCAKLADDEAKLTSRSNRASGTESLQHKPTERSQDDLRAGRKVFQDRLLQAPASRRCRSAKYLHYTEQ